MVSKSRRPYNIPPGQPGISQSSRFGRAVTSEALQTALLSGGRCGRCAEQISRSLILRRGDCPHCGSLLSSPSSDVLEELETRSLYWRLAGYGLVAVASFVAGSVPLLQVVVQIAALFVLHVAVLRRSLLWRRSGDPDGRRRRGARDQRRAHLATLPATGVRRGLRARQVVGEGGDGRGGGRINPAAVPAARHLCFRRRLRYRAGRSVTGSARRLELARRSPANSLLSV